MIITTGLAILFDISRFESDIIRMTWESIERTRIETSTWDTDTKKTFTPADFSRPGIIRMQLAFNPDKEPPIDGAPENIQIRFPTPSGGISAWNGEGFVFEYKETGELESKMLADMAVSLSGNITRATIQQVQTDGDLLNVTDDSGNAIYATT